MKFSRTKRTVSNYLHDSHQFYPNRSNQLTTRRTRKKIGIFRGINSGRMERKEMVNFHSKSHNLEL